MDTTTAAPIAQGKRLLIEAALRLGARGASLGSLGLRELAREAGLNHNTFYRHFQDSEDLSRTAVNEIAVRLMIGLKQVRANAARHADATVGAVEYFLDFVRDNPDAFVVGVRELHGLATPMRRILQQVIDDIAEESVEQITTMNLAPGMERVALKQATTAITWYMFYRALDFLEHPARRMTIAAEIVRFIRMQFLGAAALQSLSATPARKKRADSKR